MIDLEIKIHGLAELDAELKKFPLDLQRKALGQMVGAGARLVKDEAYNNFMNVAKTLNLDPDEKRWSLRNIVMRRLKRKDKGRSTLTYGVVAQYPAFYLETGAKPHTITAKKAKSLGADGRFGKSVKHPGFAARPFLRPALDQNVQRAVNAMGYKLMAWIDRQYRKVAKAA